MRPVYQVCAGVQSAKRSWRQAQASARRRLEPVATTTLTCLSVSIPRRPRSTPSEYALTAFLFPARRLLSLSETSLSLSLHPHSRGYIRFARGCPRSSRGNKSRRRSAERRALSALRNMIRLDPDPPSPAPASTHRSRMLPQQNRRRKKLHGSLCRSHARHRSLARQCRRGSRERSLAQSTKGSREPAALGSAPPPSARPTSAVPSAGTAPPAAVEFSDAVAPSVPRVGMGEAFPAPPESDLRSEALFLIETARKSASRGRGRRRRSGNGARKRIGSPSVTVDINGSAGEPSRLTPPPSGESSHQRAASSRPNGHGCSRGDEDEDEDDSLSRQDPAAPPGVLRNFRLPLNRSTLILNSRRSNVNTRTDRLLRRPVFSRRSNGRRSPAAQVPPRQRPTVVLAPPAQGPGSIPVRRVKDKLEREYSEGYEGLLQEHEADLRRFADNVRVGPNC